MGEQKKSLFSMIISAAFAFMVATHKFTEIADDGRVFINKISGFISRAISIISNECQTNKGQMSAVIVEQFSPFHYFVISWLCCHLPWLQQEKERKPSNVVKSNSKLCYNYLTFDCSWEVILPTSHKILYFSAHRQMSHRTIEVKNLNFYRKALPI